MNISEGRDRATLHALARICGDDLLDVHTDEFHNRSVFTLIGIDAPRRLTASAVERLDLRAHAGVHPRIGVVDVVPFVPLTGSTLDDAIAARNSFGAWAAAELGLPCFLYGPERSLPDIRRGAFTTLAPDFEPTQGRPDVGPTPIDPALSAAGPSRPDEPRAEPTAATGERHLPEPHPTAGASAVGAREVLLAYNVWVEAPDLATVRLVASKVRSPAIRTLGLAVGEKFQVSCNLIAPEEVGPAEVTAAVERLGSTQGVLVTGCELVGLLPQVVLDRIDSADWPRLDLAFDRTIQARLATGTPWPLS